MMTNRYVLGNWKSNTSLAEAKALSRLLATVDVGDAYVGVAPPFPWITEVRAELAGSRLHVGAQNSSTTASGAYTGEVTAMMIAEVCSFVLIGHSERRALFGESNEIVRHKLNRVLETSLLPVLCVGETLQERTDGQAESIVFRQLESAIADIPGGQPSRLVVAYEPVWAIGTGVTASVDDANQMADYIQRMLSELGHTIFPVVYGGSVNAGNSASLIAASAISGFLVGGASLKADDFSAITASAIAG